MNLARGPIPSTQTTRNAKTEISPQPGSQRSHPSWTTLRSFIQKTNKFPVLEICHTGLHTTTSVPPRVDNVAETTNLDAFCQRVYLLPPGGSLMNTDEMSFKLPSVQTYKPTNYIRVWPFHTALPNCIPYHWSRENLGTRNSEGEKTLPTGWSSGWGP